MSLEHLAIYGSENADWGYKGQEDLQKILTRKSDIMSIKKEAHLKKSVTGQRATIKHQTIKLATTLIHCNS